MARYINHTVCEVCWFLMRPNAYPTQLTREQGDTSVDKCCACGCVKLTRIYVRSNDHANWHCDGEHE